MRPNKAFSNYSGMDRLVVLIQHYCLPAKSRYRFSSYGLKALFELLLGQYITNDEFKAAMIAAGFMPTKKSSTQTNHRYLIQVIDSPEVPIMYRGRAHQYHKYS